MQQADVGGEIDQYSTGMIVFDHEHPRMIHYQLAW